MLSPEIWESYEYIKLPDWYLNESPTIDETVKNNWLIKQKEWLERRVNNLRLYLSYRDKVDYRFDLTYEKLDNKITVNAKYYKKDTPFFKWGKDCNSSEYTLAKSIFEHSYYTVKLEDN